MPARFASSEPRPCRAGVGAVRRVGRAGVALGADGRLLRACVCSCKHAQDARSLMHKTRGTRHASRHATSQAPPHTRAPTHARHATQSTTSSPTAPRRQPSTRGAEASRANAPHRRRQLEPGPCAGTQTTGGAGGSTNGGRSLLVCRRQAGERVSEHGGSATRGLPCPSVRPRATHLAFCASESLPQAAPRALPTSPKLMFGLALTILGRCSLQNTMYGPARRAPECDS